MSVFRKVLKKQYRKFRMYFIRNIEKNALDEEDIIKSLTDSGINQGDKVMVHSSMSKIGFVEGGAQTLINALVNIAGKSGMIVMPTFPASGLTMEYLKGNPIFDPELTPSKMGAVTEEFRKMRGVRRSIHPTHPVAAWGSGAEEFTAEHYKSTRPFGKGTPFEKIIDKNLKILLIGVDFENMTACRIIEDLDEGFPVNPYLDEMVETRVIDENGNVMEVSTKVHDPAISICRKNMVLYPYLKEAGKLREFNIGKAKCYWVYARDVLETQKRLKKSSIFTYCFDKETAMRYNDYA